MSEQLVRPLLIVLCPVVVLITNDYDIVALLLLLGTIDSLFIHHAYHVITTQGVSVQIVFGFEVRIQSLLLL